MPDPPSRKLPGAKDRQPSVPHAAVATGERRVLRPLTCTPVNCTAPRLCTESSATHSARLAASSGVSTPHLHTTNKQGQDDACDWCFGTAADRIKTLCCSADGRLYCLCNTCYSYSSSGSIRSTSGLHAGHALSHTWTHYPQVRTCPVLH